jgi:hypothetical protein
MKMLIRFLAIVLLCHTVSVSAQRKPRIKGNRDVTRVEESLPSFSRLELMDDLDIVLKRSAEEGYALTADDNLVSVIKFRVENGTLLISSFYEITGKKELSITIYYNQLNAVAVSEGRVLTAEGERINADLLEVKASGNARVDLAGDVGQLVLQMGDNSKGDLAVTADSLTVELRHKANAQLYVNSFSGSVSVGDNATLDMEGTSGTAHVEVMGDGRLRAENFEVGRLTATCAGSSDSRIFAVDELQINLSGSSRCYLYGDPAIALSAFRDSAEFLKRNK